MSAQTIDWEKYQQLPPDQRRRPLTDAEYAALTKQQRIAGGLDENDEGAPANFNGPVFPNPTHIQPRADTDPAIDPTRLPEGVTFQRQNFSGTPQMDVSNPAAADVQPEMGREVAANFGKKMSAQPIDFSKYEQAAPPGGNQIDFSKYEQGAQSKPQQDGSSIDEQDRATTEAWAQNHPILGPIARFLVAGGQNAGHAITDTPGQLYHAIIDPPTVQEAGLTPEQRVISRLGVQQAVEAGLDYASGKVTPKAAISVLPEALGTGVGQVTGGAVYGKTGEIAGEVLPKVPAAVQAAGDTGARAVRAATRGANKVLAKAPGTVGGAAGAAVGGYLGGHVGAEVGGAAGAMVGRELLPQVKIPGEGFGFPNRVTGGPEVAPQYEAPAEGEAAPEEPAQPLPKPKAKTVKQSTALGPNAQPLTQAQSLSQPRTIVTDPATGRLKFSDVVEAKQQAAPAAQQSAVQQAAPTAAPAQSPAAADLESRLAANVQKIQAEEAAPKADEDLTDILEKSRDQAIATRAVKDAGKTIAVPGQGEVPRFVYRARDVGEEGVPLNNQHAQAGSDFGRIMQYAEPGQRSPMAGQVVRIDLSKLQPKDFTAIPYDGGHWVKFTRPLSEDEVTPFAGQMAGAK